MIKAIRIHSPGGPEVMKWEDVPRPEPARRGSDQAGGRRPRTTSTSIFAAGLYKAPTMPLIIGQEGAGAVLAVGPGVTAVKPGDRVAYAGAAGRLCHRAGDRRRPPREAAGRDRLQDRRRDDAAA